MSQMIPMTATTTNPPTSATNGSTIVLPAGHILPSVLKQIPARMAIIVTMVAHATVDYGEAGVPRGDGPAA